MIIDGKKIAEEILSRLKGQPRPEKFFGAVLVGDDPASVNFLKQKEKTANDLGIEFRLYKLPVDITTDGLRAEIGRLASPKKCGGFIVQLPLPEEINRHYALNAIPKEKDVDFLSEPSLGAFYTGRSRTMPPSAGVVEEILKLQNVDLHKDLRSKTAVMVGAGFLVGKPVGFWLQNRVAELIMFDASAFDASANDFYERLSEADIVVSGTGVPGLFSAEHLKKGAVVIDFGFSRDDYGKILGDFDPSGADENSISYTKTPGGTGPVLVAKLFENFYKMNVAG